jgi:hypothetical protein
VLVITLADAAVTGVVHQQPGVYVTGPDTWDIVPLTLGPTWDKDPSWDGPRDPEGYILPKLTLGWQAIKWGESNLLSDETDEHDRPLPFKLTNEQLRFILWFYAIDENGRFLYREIVLQRLKGHGKDPLAAFIIGVEFVGPCRFAGWVTEDQPDLGLEAGDPYAKPHPRSWIQLAAVSKDQNKNTFTILAGIFTEECIAEHSIDIGKEIIYAYHGKKRIEAVTSSPRALEGNRPTLVIGNEPHQWLANNEGHAMADAIERNATKAKGGAARQLYITNAFNRSADSIGQRLRDSYDDTLESARRNDMMYDSLEAPRSAKLVPPNIPKGATPEEQVRLTEKYLTAVLEVVRGDSKWLHIPDLVASIMNPRNPVSRSLRFWFNSVATAEDAWLDPVAIKAGAHPLAVEARKVATSKRETLEAGWLVLPDDPVVLFLDASKSDDSTALVGCRLSDAYIFTGGVWQKPPGKRGEKWLVDRDAVDAQVERVFTRLNVVAFWGDPSHTKDDLDDTAYWGPMFDHWMQKFSRDDERGRWKGIDPKFWPVKSGLRTHAVKFDMAAPQNQLMFIRAAMEFVLEMERLNDIEEFEPSFQHDGHPALVKHMENAIRYPHPLGGVSLMKENRESKNKIDLAVSAVGARMMRNIILNLTPEEEEKPDNEIWGA